MNIETILQKAGLLAREFASERDIRQRRTQADPDDFRRLQEAGMPLMAVPVGFGGTWESLAQSVRPICAVLRTVAQGDASVALVSAMHPLVLSSWRIPDVPEPFTVGWARQRREVFETVLGGAWWGTIVSEPGSGGDISKSEAAAVPQDNSPFCYRLSGQKHFGSGSGINSFMTTRAVAAGESDPDTYFLDVRDVPWDGSTGMRLVAEWAGHGMMSTNSHAFEFREFPAMRVAWPGHQREFLEAGGGLGSMAFSSVVVGVVDVAMDYTRRRLRNSLGHGNHLRAFQQVEWSLAEQEAWLIDQAFEGALRAFGQGSQTRATALMAKQCIAGLAESVLARLCKIAGGGAYTWYTPLGAWFEDVRSLGYLRPPWALAFDQLFEMSLQD